MNEKTLNECSREELLEIIKSLKKRKKFGLVWEDKPEKVATECRQKLPVVKEVADKAISTADIVGPTNIIIEGDNYHALSVLNYTHTGKVDMIYIDPPYNTGNRDFIYNDRFIDKDDSYRHSKWLCFMSARLELSRALLKDGGIFLISIDNNEYARLKLLCDEIFGSDNCLATFIWHNNKKGRQMDKYIKNTNEYILVYTNNLQQVMIADKVINADQADYPYEDEISRYKKGYPLHNGTAAFHINNRPNLCYSIYIRDNDVKIIDEKVADENGEYKLGITPEGKELIKSGYKRIIPKYNEKYQRQRVWRWGKDKFLREYRTELILVQEGDSYYFYQKKRVDQEGNTFQKFTNYIDIDTSRGKNDFNKIFGTSVNFDAPKPCDLIKYLLTLSTNKNTCVLDFFAGSGTTGQAVLELNKEDGGHRQFILCTNNENQIAEEITYPRIKAVVEGYSDAEGIPANVRYFKTDFVEKDETLDKLRRRLSPACEDMIRIREGAFDKVIDEDKFKVYKNSRGLTAVVFDRFELADYIARIEELETDTPVHLYVFSYTNYGRLDELSDDLKHTYESQPIPEGVLEIYKRIFSKGGKR